MSAGGERRSGGGKRLRVGSVPYLVARPLDGGLDREPGIELSRDVPARLVERLRAAELDVALVSSIELFRRPGYRYLDGLAVGGDGFVSSVQVFLRAELDRVRRIALDPASRAAAALTRVVLSGRDPALRPELAEVPPGADPRAADADGWLRIGDAALREYFSAGAPPVLNPSEEWRRQTGLPFAFAVWIVRPEVAVEPWLAAFARARRRSAETIEQLVEQAVAAWDVPADGARRYLAEECRYELGPELGAALLEFRDRAAAEDLCRADVAPGAVPIEGLRVS